MTKRLACDEFINKTSLGGVLPRRCPEAGAWRVRSKGQVVCVCIYHLGPVVRALGGGTVTPAVKPVGAA